MSRRRHGYWQAFVVAATASLIFNVAPEASAAGGDPVLRMTVNNISEVGLTVQETKDSNALRIDVTLISDKPTILHAHGKDICVIDKESTKHCSWRSTDFFADATSSEVASSFAFLEGHMTQMLFTEPEVDISIPLKSDPSSATFYFLGVKKADAVSIQIGSVTTGVP